MALQQAKKLYPPNIEGIIPAFYANSDGTATIVVPFSMNKTVHKNEVADFHIKIKTIQSNKYIYNSYAGENNYNLDTDYEVRFNISAENMKLFNKGQYYKIQIAYVNGKGSNQMIGYYSTVGVIKYTTKPEVVISGLEHNAINTHNYQYIGRYSQQNQDISEKVYSYCFNLYNNKGELIETSGEQIHNGSNDTEIYESIDYYSIPKDLEINKSYYLEYIITTNNKMRVSSNRYRIMQKSSIDPEIKANVLTSLNYENGYINVTLQGLYNEDGLEYAATGAFKILRASSKDGFTTWNEILKFSLYGQQPSRWLWKDMTIEQGVAYKYALQQYNDSGLTSNRLESEEVYSDFEHAYLFDGQRQLKIKYNPKVSTFKNDILESKTDTIGGQYPFIFRNGTVKYKEFPISGLISCQLDEEFLFVNEDDIKNFDGTSNLISENIAAERDFKLEVLEWLNNGQPKLFRSPTEGNYIVRLLNVSMSPNDTLGRMLHTFTATAYEIAKCTYENLSSYGLTFTNDPTVKQLRWETINLEQAGLGSGTNILKNVPAVSLRFENMIPGDKLYINDGIDHSGEGENEKSIGFYVTIGVTGSYILDLKTGVQVYSVEFIEGFDDASDDWKYVTHQGSLTYAYYSNVQNKFDTITNITIQDVATEQFIGEHDILNEILDVRTFIHDIYWIRAFLRETVVLSDESKINENDDPYIIYEINSSENNKYPYYYDKHNDKRYSKPMMQVYQRKDQQNSPNYYTNIAYNVPVQLNSYTIYEVLLSDGSKYYLNGVEEKKYNWEKYEPEYKSYYSCEVYFNRNALNDIDKTSGVNLYETYELYMKQPKDITTLCCGCGIIAEIAYQKQTLDYKVETDERYYDTYPELQQAKQELDEAEKALRDYITPYDEDGNWLLSPLEEDDVEGYETGLRNAYQLYNTTYNEYIKLLEEALIAEKEALGDVL